MHPRRDDSGRPATRARCTRPHIFVDNAISSKPTSSPSRAPACPLRRHHDLHCIDPNNYVKLYDYNKIFIEFYIANTNQRQGLHPMRVAAACCPKNQKSAACRRRSHASRRRTPPKTKTPLPQQICCRRRMKTSRRRITIAAAAQKPAGALLGRSHDRLACLVKTPSPPHKNPPVLC
jgi:hypothetical protein